MGLKPTRAHTRAPPPPARLASASAAAAAACRVPGAGSREPWSLGALEPWALALALVLVLVLGSWFLVLGNWSLGWSLGLFVGLVVAWSWLGRGLKIFLDKLNNVLGSYVHIRMTMYIRRMDKELNTVQVFRRSSGDCGTASSET
ncbi:hypothetical protein OROGR_000652 [Orobanche gracilis]